MQEQTDGIRGRAGHQPPKGVGTFGGEAQRWALQVESRTHNLFRFTQAFVAVGKARHALQQAPPIKDSGGRPQIRLDREAAEKLGVKLAITSEGFESGK